MGCYITAHGIGSTVPALAKSARTGHPQFRNGKGTATLKWLATRYLYLPLLAAIFSQFRSALFQKVPGFAVAFVAVAGFLCPG
jgi:hypothetical protein